MHTRTGSQFDALLTAFDRGERRARAAVLTELERGQSNDLPELLRALSYRANGAVLIGVTGPPGAGKSTLVNALVAAFRARSRSVAVIAVDPSSPVSGGSILGDRIRMSAAGDDPGVLIRSLASAGHLGGLTPAAVRLVDGLDAAGFDPIIIETVGTGQNEVDIARIADVKVVVSAPGLGDGVQAMKSGLLEIADIMVVNKADRDGAEQTREQLASAARLQCDGSRSDLPVILTVATTGTGIDALVDTLSDRCAAARRIPQATRRSRRARFLLASAVSETVRKRIEDPASQPHCVDLAERLIDGRVTAADAADELLSSRMRNDR